MVRSIIIDRIQRTILRLPPLLHPHCRKDIAELKKIMKERVGRPHLQGKAKAF